MYSRKLVFIVVMLLFANTMVAQQATSIEEADIISYDLYQKGEWKNLLAFGNTYVATAPDFLYLRLRMGYAAFMLNNFSKALQQYEYVIQKDATNETAHYYSWLCRKYLQQPALADIHTKYFSMELKEKEKWHTIGVTQISVEASYKATDLTQRGDGLYTRIDVGTRLGRNIHMQHAGAIFNQTIDEPLLPFVVNNNNIAINQKEYYNKTIFSINRKWQAIAAYHYLYTPFNNFEYNNHIGLLGVKYNHHYFALQADAILGTLTDTSFQQYNATLSVFPLGNINLYGFSTASYSIRNNKSTFNFKQVIGGKVLKFLWVEANATFGAFNNFLENDALYVYNAIDKNNYKAGATAYISVTPKIIMQVGYTYEQRQIFLTNNNFNQHSITGGITCKF
jgi:hypothetical protein